MSGVIKESVLTMTGILVIWLLLLGVLVSPIVSSACAGEKKASWGEDPSRGNEGPIMFVLTPKGVESGEFLVDILVNTHSGDLGNLDLKKQVHLKSGGKSYSPTKAVRLGGHHAGGTLIFPLKQAPERFEIVIQAVGTMGDVAFRWP